MHLQNIKNIFFLLISIVSMLSFNQSMASTSSSGKYTCQFLENTSWHGDFAGGDYRRNIRIKFGKIEKMGTMYRIVNGSINNLSIANTSCSSAWDMIQMSFYGDIAHVAIGIEFSQQDISANKIRSVRVDAIDKKVIILHGDLIKD